MEIPEPIKCDLENLGGIDELVKRLPKSKQIENLSNIFRGISDKYRIKILFIVAKQPVCVCIIKEILGISDSKLSYHLSILKDHGLIYSKQLGNWLIYYPTKTGEMVFNLVIENLKGLDH
jgi:ArsR family transcriptional regulator